MLTRTDLLEFLAHRATTSLLEVPLEAARRLVVARAGLRSRRRRATLADVEATIDRLGCVQLDAISTVDRSQRLVLAVRERPRARRGAGPTAAPRTGVRVLGARGEPDPGRRLALLRRAHARPPPPPVVRGPCSSSIRSSSRPSSRRWRERGPVSSRDFGGAGTGYWNWSRAEARPGGAVDVGTARRSRVAAASSGATTCPSACCRARCWTRRSRRAVERLRYLITRTVRARGLVREVRVHDYYRLRGGRIRLAPTIEGLVERRRARARPAARERRRRARRGRRRRAAGRRPRRADAARSCSRRSTTCCGTASRRAPCSGSITASRSTSRRSSGSTGTTCCRCVDGPAIVGRVDVKADRAAGILRALAVHWQGRPRPRALREALARLAWTLGLRTNGDPLMEFETRAIHVGQEPDPLTGSVNVPIYQTSTYVQDGVGGHAWRPRLRAQHQPDPHRARALPRVARARPSTASRSPRACRRSRPSSSWSGRASS